MPQQRHTLGRVCYLSFLFARKARGGDAAQPDRAQNQIVSVLSVLGYGAITSALQRRGCLMVLEDELRSPRTLLRIGEDLTEFGATSLLKGLLFVV
jgi:hypothetical protein